MAGNMGSANNVDMTGFKNLIINGNHICNNRYTSPVTSMGNNDINSNKYITDRWVLRNFSSEPGKNFSAGITMQGSSLTPTPGYMLGNEQYLYVYGLEGKKSIQNVCVHTYLEDISRFEKKTVSISFKARFVTAKGSTLQIPTGFKGDVMIRLFYNCTPGIQIGFLNKKVNISVNDIGTTIQLEGIDLPTVADAFSGKPTPPNYTRESSAMRLEVIPLEGIDTTQIASDGYTINFDIGQIQLEYGSNCTEFENRPFALEEILCSRYFITGTQMDDQVSAANCRHVSTVRFPVIMRVNPVVKLSLDQLLSSTNTWDANSLRLGMTGARNIGLGISAINYAGSPNQRTRAIIYEADADFPPSY